MVVIHGYLERNNWKISIRPKIKNHTSFNMIALQVALIWHTL